MYRCGWATKENQQRVLAIWITKNDFEQILREAVYSSFNASQYNSTKIWKYELATKDVRIQWDPDHDPFGNKLKRKALQVGMKSKALDRFCNENILSIEDITDFVKQQKEHLDAGQLDRLVAPSETVIVPHDKGLSAFLELANSNIENHQTS